MSRVMKGSEWIHHGEYDVLDYLGISTYYCVPLIYGESLATLNTLTSILIIP